MKQMFATTCCLGAHTRWWHKEVEPKQSTDISLSWGDWVLQLLKHLKFTGLIWREGSCSCPRLRTRLQEVYDRAAAVGLSAETLLNIVGIQFRWHRGQALGIKYSALELSSKLIHKEWKQAWQTKGPNNNLTSCQNKTEQPLWNMTQSKFQTIHHSQCFAQNKTNKNNF